MNREQFSNSTRLTLMHMKAFNYKLCRKGLLERGVSMKLFIGNFTNLGNDFLKNSLISGKNEDLLNKLNEEKEKVMNKEIRNLNLALQSLDITINTIRKEVQVGVSGEIYNGWLKRINMISTRFKTMYSNINNDYYNHFYNISKKNDAVWGNITKDVQWLNNICNDAFPAIVNVCTSCTSVPNGSANGSALNGSVKALNGAVSALVVNNNLTSSMDKYTISANKSTNSVNNSISYANSNRSETNISSKSIINLNNSDKNINKFVEGFEEGDLSILFSENALRIKSNKTKIKRKVYNSGIEEVGLRKKLKNENGCSSGIKTVLDNGVGSGLDLDPVSETEDESSIMDSVLLMDEVGDVNITDFIDMIAKIDE